MCNHEWLKMGDVELDLSELFEIKSLPNLTMQPDTGLTPL